MPVPLRPGVKALYSGAEVRDLLGMTFRALYNWRKRGTLKPVSLKVSGRSIGTHLYRRSDLLAVIDAHNLPAHRDRLVLQPPDSNLLLASTDDKVIRQVSAVGRVAVCPSLVEAAFRLYETPHWAVLIDCTAMGAGACADFLSAIRTRLDPPHLFGYVDEYTYQGVLDLLDFHARSVRELVAEVKAERVTADCSVNPNREKPCRKRRKK